MDTPTRPATDADANTPTTIAQAFEQWLDLDRQIMALLDAGAGAGAVSGRRWVIENHAVTLPTITAQDVWALLRMTSDENNMGPKSTQDQVVSRAYVEVAKAAKS
jgi:hypothetical protein